MPPKAKKKAYTVADIDAQGLILQDLFKNKWKVGEPVGIGGFGKLYEVTCVDSKVDDDGYIKGTDKTQWRANCQYVLKIEPAANGPLFTELSFYTRRGKQPLIEAWMKQKQLKKFGMPSYVGSGITEVNSKKYRFMVMPLFGCDLQKLFMQNKRRFPLKTVCYIALQVLDVLEYLHKHEYVHADIKAANLLLDKYDPNQIYLVDYGLAYKFRSDDGKHVPYKEDLKRAHDGTIEFTSIDAHFGCKPSQRGDLEILGYCLLQWLCGSLPWESDLSKADIVRASKVCFKAKTKQFIEESLQSKSDTDLTFMAEYMSKIYSMGYDDNAGFGELRKIFKNCLQSNKIKDDGVLKFTSSEEKSAKKRKSSGKSPTPKRKKPSTLEVNSAKKSSSSKITVKKATPKRKAIPKYSDDSSSSSPPTVGKSNGSKSPKQVSPVKKKGATARKKTAIARPSTSKSTSKSTSSSQTGTSKIIPIEASILPARGDAAKRESNGSKSSPAPKQVRSNGVQTSPGLKGLRAMKKRR